MSHTTYIFKQSRRRQTPITLCPLCKTEPRTTPHLFQFPQNKHKLTITDLWTAPWRWGISWLNGGGKPFCQLAWMLAEPAGDYHQPVCLDTTRASGVWSTTTAPAYRAQLNEQCDQTTKLLAEHITQQLLRKWKITTLSKSIIHILVNSQNFIFNMARIFFKTVSNNNM